MEFTETVREFIVKNFLFGDAARLDDTSSLMEKGIIDSTGIMEIVQFIEDKFKFKIDDDELLPENFDTVNSISSYIGKKIGK